MHLTELSEFLGEKKGRWQIKHSGKEGRSQSRKEEKEFVWGAREGNGKRATQD